LADVAYPGPKILSRNGITRLFREVSAEKSRVTLNSSFAKAKCMRGWPSALIRSTVPARLRTEVEGAAESPEELVPREESDHHRVASGSTEFLEEMAIPRAERLEE
jgi:hypothetical protein